MFDFKLNTEKAINSLLYVVHTIPHVDVHKLCKVLYFADQKHLLRYGRPITGDTYVKMEYGPVPSYIKNIVDLDSSSQENFVARHSRFKLVPLKDYDLDWLSESDLECINESIEENKDLTFQELTNKSHDSAWEKSTWVIHSLDIAKVLEPEEETLKFIKHSVSNDLISFE